MRRDRAAERTTMITIGQLADYAGVTVRAVRHYHERGLLDEPARDASGYRRYTAHHAIELIKIKTLADAGVPLARVEELHDAAPAEFARAVEEIDRGLEDRIGALTRARERIRRLSGGDRLFVPEEVADYLDDLRDLGLSPRYLQIERDLWILLWAVQPGDVAGRLNDRRNGLADPEIRCLFLDFDRSFTADPDDPSLHEIAGRMIDLTIRRYGQDASVLTEGAGVRGLVQEALVGLSPAWDEIYRIVRERSDRSPRR
jgi:DNA-binding transcriptional MerR regulator